MPRYAHLLSDVGLGLLAAVVGASTVLLVASPPGAADRAGPSAEVADDVQAVFLTDQLGAVTPAATSGPLPTAAVSAAELAAAELDLDLNVVSVPLFGFTTAPPGGRTLAMTVQQSLLERSADVVLLQGGYVDAAASRGNIGAGAMGAVDRLRQALPLRTRLVLVGPVGTTPSADPALLRVRDALREVASRKRVYFLDPLAGSWVTGPVAADGRLTPEQHRQAGRALAEGLRVLTETSG